MWDLNKDRPKLELKVGDRWFANSLGEYFPLTTIRILEVTEKTILAYDENTTRVVRVEIAGIHFVEKIDAS